MNWVKKLFSKKEENLCAISVVVSSVTTTDKCLCELNTEGLQMTGWCRKHHTDWL